jgi:hypothetical protein
MMGSSDKKNKGVKQKIFREMVEYWINVVYLGKASRVDFDSARVAGRKRS